jgi:hypothetical protein
MACQILFKVSQSLIVVVTASTQHLEEIVRLRLLLSTGLIPSRASWKAKLIKYEIDVAPTAFEQRSHAALNEVNALASFHLCSSNCSGRSSSLRPKRGVAVEPVGEREATLVAVAGRQPTTATESRR